MKCGWSEQVRIGVAGGRGYTGTVILSHTYRLALPLSLTSSTMYLIERQRECFHKARRKGRLSLSIYIPWCNNSINVHVSLRVSCSLTNNSTQYLPVCGDGYIKGFSALNEYLSMDMST